MDTQLIYDWNFAERRQPVVLKKRFELHDETLRDGLQNPSVVDPTIDEKLEILHLLDQVGVDTVDVGLPGAGPRAFEDVLRLCREIADCKLAIRPTCAGRTHLADIEPMAKVAQRAGIAIEVMTFIGSSPIRALAEDWSVELIRKRSVEAISFAVKEGLPVNYVTEDTTRSKPEVLHTLFHAAIESGATRLTLCDTVGHVTPDGVRNLVQFTRSLLSAWGAPQVGIDWHGHNDRGLGVTNSIYALEYGADRVHGAILGVGERVGNASLDQILVNLKLIGELGDRDVTKLGELCDKVSKALHFPIPINYPVVGEDAFRTGTGVHAAAIIKALEKGDQDLADRVYSGVPAWMFGREQEIGIGPMSGASNVNFWLKKRGFTPSEGLVKAILARAKESNHLLTDAEVREVITKVGAR
ncbi:LeuA family protein [Sandaracinus amylolyticus]|uniref:2-isopropylmalate synthase n=1 Tax=Sandaracinus amylolyticus TaxID=927083 RepID=A0A0F6W7P5_9BACT|nr:LeuA family protein [Sandaracinus amylolyticus]AKF09612.1 2-isopropylmalate synthase [Sandaracinus amylolyticus]